VLCKEASGPKTVGVARRKEKTPTEGTKSYF